MNIQAQKLNLIERLMLLHDKAIISKIEKILGAPLQKSQPKLKPMTIDEFYERIEQSEKAIKQGRTISQEDLEKEVENW